MRDGKKNVKDEQGRSQTRQTQSPLEQLSKNKPNTKHVKIELQDSKTWYRAIFDNANDAIFLIEADRFIDCNPKTLEMFGCTKEQIIGQRPYDRFSPMLQPDGQNSKDKALEKIRLALEGQPQFFEWRHLRNDGTPFEVEVSLNRVEFSGHFYIQSFVRDITKQKHTYLQYEIILKTAMDSFGVFDAEGNILEVNDAYCNLLGYSRKELLSMNIMDIEASESPDQIKKRIQKLISSNSHRFETHHRCKDGTLINLDVSANILENDGQRIFAFYRDITKYKQAEKALRKSEERFRGIFENSLVGLYQTTPDGRILMANPALVRMLGNTSFEELAARNLEQDGFEPGYPRSEFKRLIEAKGQIVGLESAWLKRDETTLFIRESAQAIRDDAGNILYYQGTVEDITERKKAEAELRQERDKIQKYLDVAGVLFLVLDAKGIVTLINHKGCELLDYEEKNIVGKNWFDNFLPKGIGQKVKSAFEKLIKGEIKSVEYFENSVLTKSGQERQIAWHNTVLKDENNRIVGTLSSGEDITGSKRAQEALAESEAKFHSLVENIPGVVWTTDENGNTEFISSNIEKMYGYTPSEIYKTGDQLWFGRIHPDDVNRVTQAFKDVFKKGKPLNIEYRIRRKDGQWIWLQDRSIGAYEKNGIKYADGAFFDITDRKDAEGKLQQYQEQLKSLALELSLAEERERRRIAAGIHDDIAQRLALAKFELKSMQKTISDTDVLTSLENQCDTMDRIMQDTRSLTFELSNPLLYEIGLGAAIESFLTEQIQEKNGIKCTFTSQEPHINLNEEIRVVLYQGVRELLTNVVKYANASQVDVRVMKSNNQISLVIQDNGIGFNVSILSLPDRDRGGFGLFNIRERLEYLDGNLNIQSTLNSGTCVTMSIPLISQAAAQEKERLP